MNREEIIEDLSNEQRIAFRGMDEIGFSGHGSLGGPSRTIKITSADVLNPVRRSKHQNVLVNMPAEASARKAIPLFTGVLDYFPAALIEVAKVSKAGNDQHNPGQPLHWERGKSTDQEDTIARHLLERGTYDTDGIRHTAKAAWRILALLQEEIEAEKGFKPCDPSPTPDTA